VIAAHEAIDLVAKISLPELSKEENSDDREISILSLLFDSGSAPETTGTTEGGSPSER